MNPYDEAFASAMAPIGAGAAAGAPPPETSPYAEIFQKSLDDATRRSREHGPQWGRRPLPAAIDPTANMTGMELFLTGAGKAFQDVGRGAGQWVGAVSREDVAKARKEDEPYKGRWQAQLGNLAANVGMSLPLAMLPKANTIMGAAGYGGVYGALQPSTSTWETIGNVGAGTLSGAAGPALVRAGQVIHGHAQPFYQTGRERIVGRAIQQAMGMEPDDAARALTSARSRVPGVQYTAAEAAADAPGGPGLAALQRTAHATVPAVTNDVTGLAARNNEARQGLLSLLAGDDGPRRWSSQFRKDIDNIMYERARTAPLDPRVATAEAQENMAKFADRIPQEIHATAKKLAQMEGIPLDDTTSVQGMHWLKRALDREIKAAKSSGDSDMARAYTKLQKDLVKGLEEIQPEYRPARLASARNARPVTEMNVVAEVRDKATDPLTGNIRPQSFARAYSDDTAARVSGMPDATLGSTLSPSTRWKMDAITDDLRRAVAARDAGRGSGSDTVQKLAYSNLLDQAGVPTFIRSFAPAGVVGNVLAQIGRVGYSGANKELSEQLASSLLNPDLAAQLVRGAAGSPKINAMRDLLRRASIPIGLGYESAYPGIGGLLSVPAQE